MNEIEIKQSVLDVLGKIAPEADFSQLGPDENVRQTLDIDSFDYLNFLVGLHQALGVEIPESDYAKLTTLSDIVRYVSDRIR